MSSNPWITWITTNGETFNNDILGLRAAVWPTAALVKVRERGLGLLRLRL